MKTINRALVTLVLCVAGGATSAQMLGKDLYAEVGVLDLQVESSISTRKPLLGRVVVGQDLNRNLSVEALAGFTLRKDAGVSTTTYGAFLKPKMEVVKDVDVFGRIGVAHTENKTDGGSSGATKVAYGLGVQTVLTKSIYTQIDYMRYGKDDQGKSDKGFTFSAGYRF